ncbi:MAG: cobalamin biosynthesis protein [Magnetococcus sp. DMHC-8]
MMPASSQSRPALVALTRHGAQHAARLAGHWPEAVLYLLPPWTAEAGQTAHRLAPPLRQHVARLLREHNPVCFFCALGAVVRLIAPHLGSKRTDPAVLAVDETARFVIPVVAGHLGGANQHARRIAHWLHALPVITTASDALGTLAVDLLGRELGWQIRAAPAVLTRVAACVVNGAPVAWVQECGSRRWRVGMPDLPSNVLPLASIDQADPGRHQALLWITRRIGLAEWERQWPDRLVLYRPPAVAGPPLIIGIGCDRGTPVAALVEALTEARRCCPFGWDQVTALATIDRKGDEEGLLQLAERFDLALTLYPAEQLARVAVPHPSETVRRHMGTPSVAEAAALLAGSGGEGALLLPKLCYRGSDGRHVTLAIARGSAMDHQEHTRS